MALQYLRSLMGLPLLMGLPFQASPLMGLGGMASVGVFMVFLLVCVMGLFECFYDLVPVAGSPHIVFGACFG